ncbi:hypothetical protein CSB45_12625 [candidate division KSB3 bacterium]|uniref:Sulfatase N-terminal domain-containing protein n=1 Tax=candidate division KSB3 bacterium TaxID=2044937 RepID=A0A2G6E2T2_9BACT|nr:MAG: hypothetical protein CSB45_12625 [candidate division KSB3 bacterium]
MKLTQTYLQPLSAKGPFHYDAQSRHENILFLSLDMVPREFYGVIDTPVPMRTPTLDALKQQHIFFSSAYCTSPLCSPSRASFLSGRYSYITVNAERAHDGQAVHVRQDDSLFPEYLKSIGYHTRHVGKSHIGTHKFMDMFSENDSPWDRWSPPWNDDEGYIAFLRQKGFGRMSFERCMYGQDASSRGPGNFYGGWIAPQNGRAFPKEASYPAYLVDKAIQTLETRQNPEQPFYLQLDFFGPHQPFAIPAGMEEREREIRETLELPETYLALMENNFNPPWEEARVYRLYRKNWGMNDPDLMKDYMTANILQFELLDELIGKFFDYLKENDLYNDSWIYLIADHGEMNGELALIDKGAYLNPASIRVPLYLKPPAQHEYGSLQREVTTPVSLLDLAPTIFQSVGITNPERLDGVSLFKAIDGQERPKDTPLLCEIWSHAVPNPAVGMIFRAADGCEYMFSFNACDDLDELYRVDNCKTLRNLYHDESTADIVQEALLRMEAALDADARWNCYSGYFKLTYADRLGKPIGDRQKFF